jgi:hypothetical protein
MQISKSDLPAAEASDRQWRTLYCVSGVILLLTTVLSFVVAWGARTLYSSGYPGDPASYLQLVSQHQGLANLTWSLWIVLDFLGIPVIVAMYLVLRRHNHTLAALASLLCLFYAVYDFGVTELNSLTLVSLSRSYAEATSDAAKATFVAAATYGYYALPLQTVLSFAIGPLGYLLWCVPMAKSFFGRWWAIVGVIVSLIGLAGSVASLVPTSYILGLCQFICVRAIALWFIPLGVLLYRHGYRLRTEVG